MDSQNVAAEHGEEISSAGRTALVTGAGSGMGRAIALALSAEGWNVVVADLNIDAANSTVSAARASQGRAHAVQVDVRSRQSVHEMVEQTVATFGSLELGVNFAGITGAGTLVADTTEEHVRAIVDVNLLGVWHSMAEEVSAMLKAGNKGLIINAASAMALRAAPRSAAYAMAKAAIVHASRSTAVEYASNGIRVIAVAPGPVNTPMYQANTLEVQRKIAAGVPLGRPAESEEIARAVVWLASSEAAYMTGTVFTLDGGDSA
ncbi:MAG: short-chain dehydrogenase [Subtercola sp.]|nr:short-chain dehydrogenase [Subtercola sp.]